MSRYRYSMAASTVVAINIPITSPGPVLVSVVGFSGDDCDAPAVGEGAVGVEVAGGVAGASVGVFGVVEGAVVELVLPFCLVVPLPKVELELEWESEPEAEDGCF